MRLKLQSNKNWEFHDLNSTFPKITHDDHCNKKNSMSKPGQETEQVSNVHLLYEINRISPKTTIFLTKKQVFSKIWNI